MPTWCVDRPRPLRAVERQDAAASSRISPQGNVSDFIVTAPCSHRCYWPLCSVCVENSKGKRMNARMRVIDRTPTHVREPSSSRAMLYTSRCYTEKASPTRHRPERQHNARANRSKQCSPNETKPYSKPTLPRKRQTTPTNGVHAWV